MATRTKKSLLLLCPTDGRDCAALEWCLVWKTSLGSWHSAAFEIEREGDDWRAHSSLVMTALHCFKFDFKFDYLFLISF